MLTAVGLGLLLGVVLAMMGIYRGLVDDALSLLQRPAADVWVVEAGTLGPFAEPSQVRRSVREGIAHMDGVEEAGAILYQSLEVPRANDATVRIQLVGFESGRLGGPPEVVDGRGRLTSRYELVADVKTGFQLGEWLTIADTGFRVVGLIKGQVSSGGDPVVYTNLKDAQEVGANAIAVACPLCHANLDTRQSDINAKYNTQYNIPIYYFTQLMGLAFGFTPKELGVNKHLTEVPV